MISLIESDRRVPLVTLNLTFRRGRIDDPPERLGVGSLTARMVRRGTSTMDATAVEQRLDALGADLRAWVGLGITTVTVEMLARNLEQVTDLVGTLLEDATRAPSEWERLAAQVEAELVRDLDEDALLADRALRRHVFGDHPHGRRSILPRTVRATTVEHLAACHRERFVRADTIVGWAGDVAEADAERLGQELLARLPEGSSRAYPCADPAPPEGRRLVVIDKPGRSQTQLALGTLGTRGDDPDHIALQLAHAAFAGTFSAPLNHAIRTERGLAYDVSSGLLTGRVRELFYISAGPAVEDGPETLALALELLERWRDEGPTGAQLEHARRYLRRRWPFERDTASKRLSLRLEELVLGLPEGYHRDYLDRVAAVSLEEARGAVARRVDPTRLCVAAVVDEAQGAALTEAVPGLSHRIVEAYDDEA